ncbi:MAG: hypothetical protein AB7O52_05200 [Planctomycetota bacterium]
MHTERLRGLRVAAVHSPRTSCECHRTVQSAGARFGFEVVLLSDDSTDQWASESLGIDLVIDSAESFRGVTEWRWWPRAHAERLGWPVVGSRAETVRLCDNKALARQVLAQAGVATARGVVLPTASVESTWETLEAAELGWPVVLKPLAEHGSVGVALCGDRDAVGRERVPAAHGTSPTWLAEEFLPGREFHVCIAGIEHVDPLPLVEIVGLGSGIYTGADKRDATHVTAVAIDRDDDLQQQIRAVALRAHAALGMRGLARFDIRLDRAGAPRVLEANTKPSLEVGCALDVAARACGMDVESVIARAILDRLESLESDRRGHTGD